MPYTGPAEQWYERPDVLSNQQLLDLERTVTEDPHNVCACGYLIAHGVGNVRFHESHVLWMVRNHPEWDGFLLNYVFAASSRDRVRRAWI